LLWEKYFELYSTSDVDNIDQLKPQSYESIIDHFRPLTDAFVTAFDLRNRDALVNVQGHPTILVEHVIQQFLSFITVKTVLETSIKYTDGYSWLNDPNHAESILNQSVMAFINKSLFTDETLESSFPMPFSSVNLARRRQHFLNILTMTSILLRWPHNQSILLARYGFGFARVIVDVIQHLEEIVDDLVTNWSTVNESSFQQLNESSSFILHVCLQLTHIYAGDGVTIPKSEFDSISMIQPFTLATVKSLREGFDGNSVTSNPSIEEDVPPDAATEKENYEWTVESTMLGFLDPFIGLSSVGVFSTILRKLCQLSTVIAQLSLAKSLLTSTFPPQSINALWRSCLIIQVEILSAFMKVMRNSSSEFAAQYVQAAGCFTLKSLLSLRDVNANVIAYESDRVLLNLRTLLSLRLNLGIIDIMKCSAAPFDDSSLLQPEFLHPLIRSMIHRQCEDVLIPMDPRDLDIEYLAPCHIPLLTTGMRNTYRKAVKIIDPVEAYQSYDLNLLKQKSSHNFYSTRCCQQQQSSISSSKPDSDETNTNHWNIFQLNPQTEFMEHFFDILYCMLQRVINVDASLDPHNISKDFLINFFLQIRQEYSALPETNSPPVFQFYFLKFLYKLRSAYAAYTWAIIHETKILSLLMMNQNFLCSGQKKVNNLLKFGRRKVRFSTSKSSTDKSSEPQDYWYRVTVEAVQNSETTTASKSSSSSAKKFFALHYKLIHDMVLDLVVTILSTCVDATINSSKVNMSMFDSAIEHCVIAMVIASSHDITMQICRLLSVAVNLVNAKSFKSKIWAKVASEVAEVCKVHVSSLSSLDVQGDNLIFHAESLPCFWPARVAVLNLLQMIVSSSECVGWIRGFLIGIPSSPQNKSHMTDDIDHYQSKATISTTAITEVPLSAAALDLHRSRTDSNIFDYQALTSGNQSNTTANNDLNIVPLRRSVSDLQAIPTNSSGAAFHRHLAVLRLVMHPRCRYVALYIMSQIFKECSANVYGNLGFLETEDTIKADLTVVDNLSSNYLQLSPRSARIQMFSSEALAHDILRVCLYIIRSSSHQKESEDSFFSSYSILESLITMVSSANHSYRSWYWKIFESFGPLTSAHRDLSWRRSYDNYYIELWRSYDDCIKHPKCSWTAEMKGNLLQLLLKFMSSILSGNDMGKNLFGQVLFTKQYRQLYNRSEHVQNDADASNNPICSFHEFLIDIMVSVEVKPSIDTITSLFEMLFDNNYSMNDIIYLSSTKSTESIASSSAKLDDSAPTFANVNMIPLIVALVPHCTVEIQSLVLDRILSFINPETSLVNLFKCTKMDPSLFDLLLDIYPLISSSTYPLIGKLLASIGNYFITVAQLKRVIHIMSTKFDDYAFTLLEAMKGMTKRNSGPQSYLYFEGETSSLLLPHMQKWPASKGYAISLWFTVNLLQGSSVVTSMERTSRSPTLSRTFSTMSRKGHGRSMYLLSLRQDAGIGIDVSLFLDFDASVRSSTKLTLRVKSCGLSKDPQQSIEIPIKGLPMSLDDDDSNTELWHHLLLSHSPATMRKKSEMVICLDGVISKHTLSYPKYTDCINYPVIGDCNPLFKDENQHINFKGKLSSIYFFSDALSDEQMLGVYSLGSSYCQIFNDYEHCPHLPTQVDPGQGKVLNGSLTSLIMLAFNPGVWKKRYLLDITPEKNVNRWKVVVDSSSKSSSKSSNWTTPNALRMKGTYRCMTKNMSDAFDCLGGVKVLLPMLSQLDKQSATTPPGLVCAHIMDLFFTLMRDTPVNTTFFKDNGILSLAYGLEKVAPVHLTVACLNAILSGFSRLSDFRDYQIDLLKYILGNFRMWFHAAYEVQMLLFDHLLNLSASAERLLQEAMSMQTFFDIIQHLYTWQIYQSDSIFDEVGIMDQSFSSPGRAKSGSMSMSDYGSSISSSRGRSLYRIDPSQISITKEAIEVLRPKIFQILFTMLSMSAEANLFDQMFVSLLAYVSSETVSAHKIEGLQLLLRMLSPSKAQFIDYILHSAASSSCSHVLISLHAHRHAKVRIYACICMCSLVQLIAAKGNLPSPISYEAPIEAIAKTASESTKEGTSKPVEGITKTNHLESADSLSAFGFPLADLANCFLYLHLLLRNAVRDSTEPLLPDSQFEIIFQAYQLTMHGLPCKSLVSMVEKYIHLETDPLDPRRSFGTYNMFRANERDTENQNIASMKISIVSIFPTLVEIIKNDVISRRCRVKFLLELKTSLQTFDNLEMILALPRWQICFYDLLASEQLVLKIAEANLRSFGWNGDLSNPMYTQSNESHDYDLSIVQDCKAIFEIVNHLLAEIHIHAIRFCSPQTTFVIDRPAEAAVTSRYAGYTARDLLEFYSKGHRKLGAATVDESISLLRSYAETTDFDVRQSGLGLLLKIVEGIRREKDSLANTLSDSAELKEIKKKLFEVNIWMVTYTISEFFNIPLNDMRTTTRSSVKVKLEDTIAFVESYAVMPQPRSQYDKTSSGTMQSWPSQTSIDLNESVRSNSIVDNNMAEITQDDAVSLTSSGGSDANLPLKREIKSAGSDIKAGIRLSSANDNSILSDIDSEGSEYFQAKWKLVETLLDVLDIVNGGSSFNSETVLDRIRLGMKVGIVLGLTAVTQMNESIGQLIAPEDSSTPNVGRWKRGNPLTKAVDSVSWIVVRLLLNIYLHGSTVDTAILQSSPYIQALTKLTLILKSLKEKNKAYCDLEICNVICRILQTFNFSSQKPSCLWCIEGFRTIFTLFPGQKSTILQYLNLAVENNVPSSQEFLAILSKQGSSRVFRPSASAKESLSSADLLAHFQSMTYGKAKCSDVVLDALKLSLSIPVDIEVDLTWSQWQCFTSPILEDAQKLEDDFFVSKTTEFGMHRGSLEVQSMINAMRGDMSLIKDRIDLAVDATVAKIAATDSKRVKDSLRIEDLFKKKCLARWNYLLGDIANERGPLGAGVDAEGELKYWILDSHEDNLRLRSLLIQNPHGSRHSSSSYLAQNSMATTYQEGVSDRMTTSTSNRLRVLSAEDINITSSVRKSPITTPRGNRPVSESFSSIDGEINASETQEYSNASENVKIKVKPDLWKDLAKYQKRADSASPVDGGDVDEDLDNVDKASEIGDDESEDDRAESQESTSAAATASQEVSSSPTRERILFRERCEIISSATNSSTNCRSLGYIQLTKSKLSFIRDPIEQSVATTQSHRGKASIQQSPAVHHGHVISAPQLLSSISGESQWAYNALSTTHWSTAEIHNIAQRYYQLRFVAVEVFFSSRLSVFINLFEKTKAFKFQRVMRLRVRPPLLSPLVAIKPVKVFANATYVTKNGSIQSITQAWVNRDITNFEYLLRLNQYAGRTCNDLGQYPVFPWIIADYSSSELNLRNPATYRDLFYPIGAQSPQQRELLMMKYDELNNAFESKKGMMIEHGAMPPFHFGTHYSVAGFIMWFLIRCEPYTSYHIQLQDGKFDKPDRLFESLESAYRSCTNNPSDVKELIPELFYLPECLLNQHKIDFGITQTGRRIDDVILPPWAKNAYEFIRIHREALESDYVSKNLHHWIDLIFGYKQRPPYLGGHVHAEETCNCFYHLTYSDAVDLDKLRKQDKALYDQFICQISEFGSTPAQLFKKPHPERAKFNQVDIVWPIASVLPGVHTIMDEAEFPRRPKRIVAYTLPQRVSQSPIIFIGELSEADRTLLTVDTNRVVAHHSWQALPPSAVPPFKLKLDATASELSKGGTGQTMLSMISFQSSATSREHRIGVPFAPPLGYYSAMRRDTLDKLDESMKWKPMKVNAYEKVERKERENRRPSRAISGSTALQMESTPSFEPAAIGRSQYPNPGQVTQHLDKLRLEHSDSDSKRVRSLSDSTAVSSHEKEPERNVTSKLIRSSVIESLLNNNTTQMQVSDDHLSSKLFVLIPELKLLCTAGHWENSLLVTSTDTGRLIQAINLHSDVVTCLATTSDFGTHFLASGSRDCTVIIWANISTGKDEVLSNPRVLYGHDDTVNAVVINAQLNVVVSGSSDGTVMVHSLRDYSYVRSIVNKRLYGSISAPAGTSAENSTSFFSISREDISDSAGNAAPSPTSNTGRSPISWIAVSKERYIVTYSNIDGKLCTYSLNGVFLATKNIHEKLHSLILSEDGQVLVTGGDNCLVVFRWVHSLELANDGPRKGFDAVFDGAEEDGSKPFDSPIRCLYLTKLERHLIVGLESGEMRILAMDGEYMRQRLQKKLVEIGML
jgi:hypothetical protein